MTTKDLIKANFQTGDTPTQSDFEELIDSCFNEDLLQLVRPAESNHFNVGSPDNQLSAFVNHLNGQVANSASYNVSGLIEVLPGATYTITRLQRYAWYDSNQNFISGSQNSTVSLVLVAPATAAFFRMSTGPANWDTLMMTRTEGPVTFEAYDSNATLALAGSFVSGFDELEGQVSSNSSQLVSISATLDDAFEPSVNLFNNESPDIEVDKFVIHTSGALGTNATYNSTPFIEVEPSTQYWFSKSHRFAWYDQNQNYISGEIADPNLLYTSPANAAFFRMSYGKGNVNLAMIAKSAIAIPYEPYGVTPKSQDSSSTLAKTIANIGNKSTWVTPSNVLYIGDSFWDGGTNDIGARSIFHSGISGNVSLSVSGSTLIQIPSVLNGFDRSAYDTVVIGRVTNDLQGGHNFSTIQQRLLDIIVLFPDVQLVVTNAPPLNHSLAYSDAMQSVIDETNAWLNTLWSTDSSRRVFDINSVLDADGDNLLDAAYDSGTQNLHPNAAGYDAAGQSLANLLTLV